MNLQKHKKLLRELSNIEKTLCNYDVNSGIDLVGLKRRKDEIDMLLDENAKNKYDSDYGNEHVRKNDYTILQEFKILRDGWEMDNKGWIVLDNSTDQVFPIMTSHGGCYKANICEIDVQVRYHKMALKGLQKAYELLK